jgi:hypothetical protein
MMSVATFKIGRKEYVVVPRERYEQLTRVEQDAIDSEIARKGRRAYESGKMKTITHEQLKRRLRL